MRLHLKKLDSKIRLAKNVFPADEDPDIKTRHISENFKSSSLYLNIPEMMGFRVFFRIYMSGPDKGRVFFILPWPNYFLFPLNL